MELKEEKKRRREEAKLVRNSIGNARYGRLSSEELGDRSRNARLGLVTRVTRAGRCETHVSPTTHAFR